MKFRIITSNIIILLITLILIEITSFSVIKYLSINRELFKNRELFNIRDFTELASKSKRVTLKKNFKINFEESDWSVITSKDRIRISLKEKNLDKFNIKTKIKILFLGDSVPFG